MSATDHDARPVPVEYATAVERYLAASALAESSRRVYLIALRGWTWFLVERTPPAGRERRGAEPPMLALALLDTPVMARRVAAGYERRHAESSWATATRELSILRSAVAWWRARGWLTADPTLGIGPGRLRTADAADPGARHGKRPAARQLAAHQIDALLGLRVALRERLLWRLVFETSFPVGRLLALDVQDVRAAERRLRIDGTWHALNPATSQLLGWLVAGRATGPVFLTNRRAGPRVAPHDRCVVTSRARLSYRRAAELFTEATRDLDPAGHGWTLHQLAAASPYRR